jgi:hypothetical protein
LRLRNVVAHAGEPLERVPGLEVAAEGGGGVFEAPLVGRSDRDDEAGAGVVAEAPADELGGGLGGGAAQLGEQLAPAAQEGSQQPRNS